MKKTFIIIFIFFYSKNYAQAERIYLELSENYKITSELRDLGSYNIDIRIDCKECYNIDYFSFTVNITPLDKSFDDVGIEVPKPKIMSIKKLEEMPFCDLHSFLSANVVFYLVKKDNQEKYKIWPAFYLGTYRNYVKTAP